MNIRDLEASKTPQETTEHIERLMKKGSDRFETKHRRKDGQIMDVEVGVNFAETAEERFIFCFFRDITERKQGEAALRESEGKFRTLAEQSPNMIFINKKGRVVYANSRCEEVMGYTRQEFYAPDFDFLRLIAPESVEIVKSSYATHVQGGEVEPYENTLITKKGERIEAIINTRLINYEGEPAILGTVTDITERKRVEETLRESEEKYRTLVEYSLQGLNIIQGIPPRIIFANSSMAAIYGYTVDEFLSLSPDETGALVHPEDREFVWERYRDRLSGKKVPPRYEFRVIRKDGTVRWVEVFSSRIEYRGEPAVQAVLVDITERKRVEETLREQTIRNELILQTAMDGFFIIDVEGKIIKANYGASVISGYSQEEMVGMNIRDIEALESPQETTEHIERLMREGSDRFETKHRRKDGQIIDVEVGVNFVEATEERFIFCFFHDISERKRAAQALLEREKELQIKTSSLEEVNTALRVLLKRREHDKTELEEKVLFNTKELVMPYVEKLKRSGLDERQEAFVSILESNLNDIVSPFSSRLSSRYLNFTPAEMQVANLVRYGKSSKEIAEFLNVSTQTIDSHRKNIRTKMGLRKKRANLRTHLLSMQK
jgi:PAS domain S-box-containing protein